MWQTTEQSIDPESGPVYGQRTEAEVLDLQPLYVNLQRNGVPTFERGSVHGGHPGAVVFAREALDVNLQRHRPHSRSEVVQPHSLDICRERI